MAAMSTALLSHLSAGDHLVAGRALFGSCRVLVDTILPRFGIETTTVDGRDADAWARARRPNTKAFFLETPSNPGLDIVDLAAVAAIGHEANATVFVDNAFASPVLQRPLDFGADVVLYSATKTMDGQGRVLAGAVLGTEKLDCRYLYGDGTAHRAGAQPVRRVGRPQEPRDARPPRPADG